MGYRKAGNTSRAMKSIRPSWLRETFPQTTFYVALDLFNKFVAALDKQNASMHFPGRDIASALIELARLPKRRQFSAETAAQRH